MQQNSRTSSPLLGVQVIPVIRDGTLLRHYNDTICERFTRTALSTWELHTYLNSLRTQNRSSGVIVTLDDGCELHADLMLVAISKASNANRLDD